MEIVVCLCSRIALSDGTDSETTANTLSMSIDTKSHYRNGFATNTRKSNRCETYRCVCETKTPTNERNCEFCVGCARCDQSVYLPINISNAWLFDKCVHTTMDKYRWRVCECAREDVSFSLVNVITLNAKMANASDTTVWLLLLRFARVCVRKCVWMYILNLGQTK